MGTPDYVAPEVLSCTARKGVAFSSSSVQGYGTGVDVWAVGVLAWELVGGKAPFAAKTIDDIKKNVKEGTARPMPACTAECKAFIEVCMSRDVKARPSADRLLLHPWLK